MTEIITAGALVVATAGALAFGIHRWILASRRERQAQLQKREDARDAREKALWDAIHRHEDKVLGEITEIKNTLSKMCDQRDEDRKEDARRRDEDRKEDARRRDEERERYEKLRANVETLEVKIDRLFELREADRKEAELQREADRKEAELQREADRKEAELQREADRKEAELRREADRKEAELRREADRARHEALRAEVARLSDEVRELGIKVDGMSDRLTVLESKFEMFVEFVIPHAQPARHPHAGHLPE